MMTIYLQEWTGFALIPYPMRPGQSPRDILPEYRFQWVPLESGHSAIPKDVAWYPGCFVEIEDVDVGEAWAESARLRAEADLALRRSQMASEIAGQIWLQTESLAAELAMSASLAGEACATAKGTDFRLVREGRMFAVLIDGKESYRDKTAMEAARWLVAEATRPGSLPAKATPLAA